MTSPTSPKKETLPDLYPEITSYSVDDNLAKALRANGRNPTDIQKEINTALISGDSNRKAAVLEHYSALTDKVNGNNAATNFLSSRRAYLKTPQAQNSVSGTQALLGLTGNGFVDLAESLPKLATAAYGMVSGNKKEWELANKSIENFFAPLRTYVSDDYQKGLASYSSENGLELNLDAKSLIGTVGNLAGFVLPGFMTAGVGALATRGSRLALATAQKAENVADIAKAAAKLGKAGKAVETITGATSFLQMFPGYQKEALEAGLDIQDATLFAIPVAAINGWIERANVGALTKALGMSEDVAKQAIREVTTQEVRLALEGMKNVPLSRGMFEEAIGGAVKQAATRNKQSVVDAAQTAAKNALGRINRPQEMSVVGRWVGGGRRRVAQGFQEQGITEGGEEFFQSIVENASRQLYNNYGAATGATDGNGKFKDPTLGNYVFDGLYGTLLGTAVGTAMGSIVQSKKLDPTVFGYINADVRMQLSKGVPPEQLFDNLKINQALARSREDGTLDDAGFAQLQGTIQRMAQTAQEFADVEGFTDSDRWLMYRMSEAREMGQAESSQVAALKQEYTALDGQLQSGTLSAGEQLKGELRKNALAKQLGGMVVDGSGAPTGQFQAETFLAERSNDFERIAQQALAQYPTETNRAIIKDFFDNNYKSWQGKYGQLSAYDDPFQPTSVVVDPLTNDTLAFDADQRFFRVVQPQGGAIEQPMSINEQGRFVPSQREPMGYTYSQPVDDLARHVALRQTLADPNNTLSQSATSFEQPDNSPEANWLRDGESLIEQLTPVETESEADQKQAGKPDQDQVNELASAYLRDSAFLANDATYGEAYGQLAATLQSLVEVTVASESPASEQVSDAEYQDFVTNNNATLQEDEQNPVSQPNNIQQPAPASSASEPDYADEFQRDESIRSATQAETQFEQALRDFEQSTDTDGIPDAGTLEQLISALDRTIAATGEVAGEAAPATSQQSTDTGNAETGSGTTEVAPARVKASLRVLWPTLTEAQQTEARSLAQRYLEGYDGGNLSMVERIIYETMPAIRDLKAGFARYGDPNLFTGSMARAYQARPADTSAPFLDQYLTVLQETVPAATEQDIIDFIVKFPYGTRSAKTYGLAEISDQFREVTGKNLNSLLAHQVLSWNNATANSSSNLPDGIELTDQSALDIGTELLFNLTAEDAAALDVLHTQYQEQHGDSWLEALTKDFQNLFPPVSEQLGQQLESLLSDVNREPYERVRQSLEAQFSPAAPIDGDSDGEPQPVELLSGEETGVPVDPVRDGAGEVKSEGEPADTGAVTQIIYPTVSDDEYRAYRADPLTYVFAEDTLRGIAQRVATQSTNTRDMVIYQNRTAQLQPFVAEANRSENALRSASTRSAGVPQFQLIGKAGLRSWLDADPDAALEVYDTLDVAEQMERAGRSPEAIFAATGWSREIGTGKWQYELDDFQFSNEGWSQMLAKVQLALSKKSATQSFKLFDLVEKTSLLGLYPELSDYDIEFRHLPRTDLIAGTYPGQARIIFNLANPGLRGFLEQSISAMGGESGLSRGRGLIEAKLAHELQHAIQNEEGFVPGGDISYFNDIPDDEAGIERFIRRFNARLKTATSEVQRAFLTNQQFLARQILEKGLAGKSPYQLYRRLAGELYAHAVEYRALRRQQLAKEGKSGREIQEAMRQLLPLTTPTDLSQKGRPEITPEEALKLILPHPTSPSLSEQQQPDQEVVALAERIQQAFPSVRLVTDPAAYEQALIDSGAVSLLGDQRPLGFAWQGAVYLSLEATANTALHEFGHIWQAAAKLNNSSLYAQGVDLIRNSPYMERVKANPYYATLSEEEQIDEAMAIAIGDEGLGMLTPETTNRFGQWLTDLWNWIKETLGVDQNPAGMTLRDFVGQVMTELTSDNPIEAVSQNAQEQATISEGVDQQNLPGQAEEIEGGPQLGVDQTEVPQFQLPAGVQPQAIEQMRQGAQAQLERVPVLAIGAGVSADLWTKPKSDWSKADKEYIGQIKKATGFEFTSPQTLSFTQRKGLVHLADGTAIWLEGWQINQILNNGFVAAYTDKTNRGRAFRLVVGMMKNLINFDTFIGWLDNTEGTLSKLFIELKRQTQRRASYANVLLQPLSMAVEKALAPYSQSAAGTDVRTLTVRSYDYDETGAVVQREIELPIAVAMELVATAKSQLATYDESSIITETVAQPQQLYKTNPDGSFTRYPKGAVYYDENADQHHFIWLSKEDFDELRDRFENGNGAYSGEQEAFRLLSNFYNQKEIVRLLSEENEFLNPNNPFEAVDYYYPIQGYNTRIDARQKSRNFTRTLEESRQLVARQSASEAVRIGDPLRTMSVYQGAIGDILAYGRLVENLLTLHDGIDESYYGPQREKILEYVLDRAKEYQSHRAKRAERLNENSGLRGLEYLMGKYTQAIFSLNVGLPAKQLLTFQSAYGQSIIRDEFLRSTEVLGTLTKLAGAAYANWIAPSDINYQTEEGYKTFLDSDTAERPYLEELFGETDAFPDELSKQRQKQRFAAVLDRMTASQTLYTADVELKDIKRGNALDKGGRLLRKMDEFSSSYGLAAMKRADRAGLIAFVEAAKLQATAEGLQENSDTWWDRVADLSERAIYATNQMSIVADQTPLQNSTDFFSRILGLYSGQQQKLLNLILQALNHWVKTGEGSPEAAAALKRLAHAFVWGVFANALWVSTISAGSAILMALLSGDEPKSWEDTKEGIAWGFLQGVIGTVPSVGSMAADYWISQHDTIRGNESMMDVTALQTIQRGVDALDGAVDIYMAEDADKRQKALDSELFNITEFVGKATGTPQLITRLSREWLFDDEDDRKQE